MEDGAEVDLLTHKCFNDGLHEGDIVIDREELAGGGEDEVRGFGISGAGEEAKEEHLCELVGIEVERRGFEEGLFEACARDCL